MKIQLTIAMVVLATGLVFGQDASEPKVLLNARERYQKELKVAQDRVTRDYIKTLENLRDSLKDSDFSGATKVQEEIERAKTQLPMSVSEAEKIIVGTWAYSAVGFSQDETFSADHTCSNGKKKGKWFIKDGKWITLWPQSQDIRWEISLPLSKEVSGSVYSAAGEFLNGFKRTKK